MQVLGLVLLFFEDCKDLVFDFGGLGDLGVCAKEGLVIRNCDVAHLLNYKVNLSNN